MRQARSRITATLVLAVALLAATALALPNTPVQSVNAGQYSKAVTLYASATTTGTGAEVWAGNWGHPLLAITVVSGTCTDLSIEAQGSLDGTNWAPIPIAGGNATITETDVPVTKTRTFQVPAGFLYLRAPRQTVTSCTVTAVLGLAP